MKMDSSPIVVTSPLLVDASLSEPTGPNPVSQAIAALLSGSQVLATGYPLPARLSPFVYRDAQQLRDDPGGGVDGDPRLADVVAVMRPLPPVTTPWVHGGAWRAGG